MTKIESAVTVLQVADVELSINWYGSIFGFEADPFPETLPYSFAILRLDCIEIMLMCNEELSVASPRYVGMYTLE